MNLIEELFKYQDLEYQKFTLKLSPTLSLDNVIGVRVPKIKEIVKDFKNSKESQDFLSSLPHKFFEENMVHAFLLHESKDYNLVINNLDSFLKYADCWNITDSITPKSFNKNKKDVIKHVDKWLSSPLSFTVRFGIVTMINFFLDEDFKEEHLYKLSKIKSNEYYVNIALAWYYSTALIKHYDETIKIIESKILPKWIHNKSIQKAIESYRIDEENKKYLRTLKI